MEGKVARTIYPGPKKSFIRTAAKETSVVHITYTRVYFSWVLSILMDETYEYV